MVKLLSIGTALPAGLLPQNEAFEKARSYNCTSAREERVLQKLYQKTLIETRPTIFSAQASSGVSSQIDSSVSNSTNHSTNNLTSNSTSNLTSNSKNNSTTCLTNPNSLSLASFYPIPGTAGDTNTRCPICHRTTGGEDQPGTAARMARYKEEVSPLATAAARQALAKADMAASRVGNLITVSCTGFFAPGLDTEIIQTLALPRNISRTHVGFMGCHGAMNGLRVGSALAKESQSVSLVVAAELCSLHFQYGRKSDDILANALFADGAAAAVLSDYREAGRPSSTTAGPWPSRRSDAAQRADADQGAGAGSGRGTRTKTSSDLGSASYSLTASASYLLPDSRQAMTWQIGDHGFSMTLGPEVPSLIREHLAPWLREWLAQLGLEFGAVGSWAVHPGGPRVLDAVEQALALEPHALATSREIFTRLGNMSSPTILFILERLMAASVERPIVALAFGPGLTIEAALFS